MLNITRRTGFSALQPGWGALLFHLISKLYERTSVIVTTNLTFAEWPSMFGDAKIASVRLDRLRHHCHIVKKGNESFRVQQSSQTAKARVRARVASRDARPVESRDVAGESDVSF